MLGWTLRVVLSASVATQALAQVRPDEVKPEPPPSVCSGLVPTPWPATLVERRLHIRRMEVARESCIGHAPFLAAFGALWLEEGEAEQARIWLERSLMLDPDSPGAQADHALALAALGETTALKELAAAWRNRIDVPEALRQRLQVAAEPGAAIRLPTARLGQQTARVERAGRGEATLVVGYETNLAVSPRLTELTLTPPEGELVLPVVSIPRKGLAVKADVAWQTAWAVSERDLVRSGLSVGSRRAPGESSTDWYQLQGAASYSRQWNGWTASFQGDLTWFGGSLTEPYGLVRTRFVLDHVGETCTHTAQLEWDARRQSQTRTADSLTSLVAWRLQCRPSGRRDWQWSLALRGASDRPNRSGRPGGVQDSWGAVVRLEYRPTALTSIDLSMGSTRLNDREGYSPLLERTAIRTQTQTYLSLELSRALDWTWMPGVEAVLQVSRFRQDSNLALFRHEGTTAYTGLRWPW